MLELDDIDLRNAIRPHAGRQQEFLASSSDIAIFGGAAGGGKSWSLLLEPLRHITTRKDFYAIYFRRTTVQVRNPGGLWDQSMRIYPEMGGIPRSHTLEWWWPDGGRIKLAHLDHESTKLDYQGAELPLICFDELTHFSSAQFWYLLSRNRSLSGVRGYVRASTNPDSDSWVRALIDWWIDPATGQPIQQRRGVLRWFVRVDDQLRYADTPEELQDSYPGCVPKSLTFIGATLEDNPTLMRLDPGYRANLLALPKVERERLLGGNWNIRPSAGLYFNRGWVQVIDIAPVCIQYVRGWDLASTAPEEGKDPDWTACTKIGLMPDGRWIILHHDAFRGSPAEVERRILNYARIDGYDCTTSLPQDPGQAGVAQVMALTRLLAGYTVHSSPESGDKVTRFGPFSAQAEVGNVLVLSGPWNDRWLSQLENFPEGVHDDDADSTSRAFNAIAQQPPMRIDPDALRGWGQRPTL